MKKILCVVLCILMLFSLTACVEDVPSKEKATNNQSEVREEETFSLNETAVFEDLKITATKIEESKGEDFFEPEKGNVFVGVNFTVENISDETQSISSILLFEAYVDDVKCEYSFDASCVFDDGQLDGTLAPGKKMVGWYAVEVPSNWKTIEMDVVSSWLSNNAAKFVFNK